MKFKKPAFWDLPKSNFFSYLFIPFTFLIVAKNFLSQFSKKEKFSDIKTICVGNIYLGGTGKTPLVIKIYEIFKKLDKKVATVKKNYSNQKDEQLLLENKTSLIISNSRKNAILKGLNENYDVLIFDDGLQDTKIDYNLKFVCFKTNNWIGNGQIIPAGPLREKISSLKKYDAVILNGKSENLNNIKKQILNINSNIKIISSFYKILNIKEYDLKSKYLIFSGIGNPRDFKNTLIENKFEIEDELIFPDHFEYTLEDFEKIYNKAKSKGLKIITTEKDYMKVPEKYKNEIKFLNIELIIEDEDKLIKLLNN